MAESKMNSARAWLVVFTAGAFFFYSFIQMTLFSTEAMKEFFMEALSIDNAGDFGSFAGTFLYGTVALLIPVGVLLDRMSVRKLILLTIGIVILSVFGLTFTSSKALAVLFRILMGMAHCVAFMAPFRLAPRWFSSSKLALVSGLLVAFAVFGGWVSGAPMLALINLWGAKSAMIVNGMLGGVILLLGLVFLRDFPGAEQDGAASGGLSLWEGLKAAARNSQNWLAGLFIGLLNLAVLVLGAVWGTTYLKFVNPEFSEATYTGIIGMIFIGTMIGSPLCGWISDLIGSRKKAMFGGAILSLIVMVLIIYPPLTGAAFFYFLFLMLGLLTAAQSIGYPVIAESNEDSVLGTANGLSAVVLMGLGAIGQPFFGKLVTWFGGGAGASAAELQSAFGKAIWIMPVAFLIAILCVLLLRETFRKS